MLTVPVSIIASPAETVTTRKLPNVTLPIVADLSSATRWQAQIDAVGVIVSAKIRANPQSAVGLMSMGGNGPEVLSTFTDDFGKILSGLHRTKIHGKAHLASSIQVAGVCHDDFGEFKCILTDYSSL